MQTEDNTEIDIVDTDERTSVEFSWQDGHESSYDAVLLRLYCQCSKCEGKARLQEFNENVVIASVDLEDEFFLMVTHEPHDVSITLDWLKANCCCEDCLKKNISRRDTPYIDPKTSSIPTVDYKKIVENKNAALFEVADKVIKVGFCVIKNSPLEDETTLRVAEMFGPIHETVTNKMFNVRIQSGPRNTAHTALGLPYHQDLPWYETEPGMQFLHALRFDSGVIGGESQFVDLIHVAETLRQEDEEAFNDLARIPATYERIDYLRDKPAHYETLKPHIEVDYFGNIVAVHWNPGVEGTLRARGDDVDKYYKAYNKFLNIIRRPELEWNFRMDAGDVVAFNNHRMVHARTAYTSKDGEQRHLQGCYISLDDFRSTYVTLGEILKREVALTKIGNKSCF